MRYTGGVPVSQGATHRMPYTSRQSRSRSVTRSGVLGKSRMRARVAWLRWLVSRKL